MPESTSETAARSLRSLPSVNELLRTPLASEIAVVAGSKTALSLARDACERMRMDIIGGGNGPTSDANKEKSLDAASSLMLDMWKAKERSGLRRVINATGVIVHTNLGRSPLSENARRAIAEIATGYCTLEYDLETGKRGRRGAGAERMICEMTGAEAAVIVNNCAAAAFLVLSIFAWGKEAIVSRGELVEIGGDFRVPDVMAQSGTMMREVGTTNRTKLRDYETALSNETAMILRVHPSNFRIVGFTEAPDLADLADLAKRAGVILFEDAGSGALVDLSEFGLTDEPVIPRSIADGADLVSFSADKLMGGPQAGIIVGKPDLIEKIRHHPLYRALRVDKIAYAVLEATLRSYLTDRHFDEVPTLKMLSATAEEIRGRSVHVAESIVSKAGKALSLEIIDGESVIGGGSAPDVRRATALISASILGLKAEEMESRLRDNDPPVIARIAGDKVLIDLRTVMPQEEATLIEAIASLTT